MLSPDQEAVHWRKSSYSAGNDGDCVEVGHGVGIRDSKNKDGGVVALTDGSWAGFLAAAKAGTFDA